MQELSYDRKLLIEAIHDFGHWPRFIENEPHKDKSSIKGPIDSLIQDSDALVIATYMTLGVEYEEFDGMTPIEYELAAFSKRDRPVLWLQKGVPVALQDEASAQFKRIQCLFNQVKSEHKVIIQFTDPKELRPKLGRWLSGVTPLTSDERLRIIIRCSATDCTGQINRIAKFLVERKMNVDYISQAAKSGKATVYVTASLPSDLFVYRDADMRDALENEIVQDLCGHMRDRGTAPGKIACNVEVDIDDTRYSKRQLLLEIRAMDVPGQLFSVSQTLLDYELNIDRIDAYPAGNDHRYQIFMRLLVSGDRLEDQAEALSLLRELESEINRLVGVRSFTASIQEPVDEFDPE